MQTESKKPSRNLTDFSAAPFMFNLKDGTQLGLDDWTIFSEMWARKAFGSMEHFNEVLIRQAIRAEATEEELNESLNAQLQVASFQLDDHSRRIVDERLTEGMSTEEFLARQMGAKHLSGLCKAIFAMLKDSLPEGWEAIAKKKPMPAPGVRPTTKRR